LHQKKERKKAKNKEKKIKNLNILEVPNINSFLYEIETLKNIRLK
jgi:hypothetical protein